MANVLVEETSLQNIANSIREKTGTEDTYKPSEMASAISNITTKEDLSTELTTQDTLIDTQETSINDIIEALNGKAGSNGGATGDVWSEGNKIHIDISKYKPIYEKYNNGFVFPMTFNIENYDGFDSLGSVSFEETDEIVIDFTEYTDVEMFWIGESTGKMNFVAQKTDNEMLLLTLNMNAGFGNG